MATNSPWEGGSRPTATNKTADLVSDLIEDGNPIEARIVATGILDMMAEFAKAERSVSTHPGDILKAFAACTAAAFATVITDSDADPANYNDLADSCGDLVAEMTKLPLAEAGGA